MPVYPIRGRGGRGGRGGTSWVRGSSSSSSRESAPNKWRRPREGEEMVPGSSIAMQSNGSSQDADSLATSMVKRGSYQLVSKTKVDNPTVVMDPKPSWVRSTSPNRGRKRIRAGSSSPHHSITLMGQNKWTATKGIASHGTTTDDKPSAENELVKRGTHKLVLKNKPKNDLGDSRSTDKGESLSAPSTVHTHDQEQETVKGGEKQEEEEGDESVRRATTLKKIGTHKMVLEIRPDKNNQGSARQTIRKDHDVDDQTKFQSQSPPPRHRNSRDSHGRSATSPKLSGPKRGQMPFDSYNSRTMPKRIRLTTTDTTVQEVLESEGQDNNIPHSAETKDVQERLSKFAYCEVGRKGPRRHTNHTTKNGNSQAGQGGREQPRKMGLVRANRTDAPICPFYAKGMECTDRFCQKRHDVPVESAVPVCSFFQRNGQCLKEDCRFRHVKVNAQAAICTTFALLGYCENVDCTMKHVVGASQAIHPSKTIQRRNTHTQDDRVRKR